MTDPKVVHIGGKGGFGGLYNALFGDGNEPQRVALLAAVTGLEWADLGRARDAWVERDVECQAHFALYTRNGGGNRPDYADQIGTMRANPNYLSDKDDQFDPTYATFYFAVPEHLPEGASEEQQQRWAQMRVEVVEQVVEPVDMDELWKAALEKMKDPEVAKAVLEKTGLGTQLQDLLGTENKPEEGK